MMANKRVIISESQLNRIMGGKLQEGSLMDDDYNKWNEILEIIGAEKMLNDLQQFLPTHIINEFIEEEMKNMDSNKI